MKNRAFRLLLATALLSAFAAPTLQAANRPFAVTLSPFAGGYAFDGDQRLDDDLLVGLAVGYNFTERWSVEGTVGILNTEVNRGSEDGVDVYNVNLNGLYHFRPNRVLVPYLTLGLGGQSIHPGGTESDENLLFNYGAGLKYSLTDEIGLRAEVRHILVRGDLDRDGDLLSNLAYTLGLAFQLGGDRRDLPKKDAWDSDSDGVPDKFDRCPGTPRGAQADGFGCSN